MIGEIRWARERAENGAMVRFAKIMDCPYFWWICFTVGFAIAAAALPTDGSYDFKNYHFYNGFSAFHDRRALDIAPAQLQTSFFCGLDPIYYSIFTRLNDHPKLINILLSIPYSVAATTIFVIARLFARPAFVWPNLAGAAAAVFGLTGASTLPTLATTESELVPGLAILIALARWLTLENAGRNTVRAALGIGGLAGLSVGLKLTQVPLFVGMAAAIAARCAIGKRSALREAFAFGLGGLIVFAAVDGIWLWGNARTYGNPIFPLMNNVFRSDLVASGPWTDDRFLPKTTLMALLYPASWAFHSSNDVSELPMRDPRILLGCVSAVVVVLGFAARWLRDRAAPPMGGFESVALSLAIAFLVSTALMGEGLVHLSLSRDSREFERRSAACRAAAGVRKARQAVAGVRPVCAGRHLGGADDTISVVGPRPTRSGGDFNPLAAYRAGRDGSLPRSPTLTPISSPRCRLRRARSASTTISFIPALQAGSGA